MNPNAYRRSLSKFRPQQVVADASSAPGVPGMAAGNMAPPTEDAGAGVFVPPGTPGAPPQSPMGGGSLFDSRRMLPGMGSNVRPANGIGQVPNNRMGHSLNQPSAGMALTPQDKFLMQGQAGQMQQMMGLPVQQTVPGFNPGAVR